MARSKELRSYGPEYEQLLLRAYEALSNAPIAETAEFTLQLATPALAHSLRAKVYGYFAAIRSSTDRPDLLGMINLLALRIAGSALVLYRREDSWDSAALREALGLVKGFDESGNSAGVVVPPSGQAANLEKLAEIRARKKT